MSWDYENEEEELVKAVKLLAGTTAIPFKLAADIAGDLVGSLEHYGAEILRVRLAAHRDADHHAEDDHHRAGEGDLLTGAV